MTDSVAVRPRIEEDPVSNVLKWVLLAVAVGSFALFAWATVLTYERAAPQPDRYVTAGGATVMTGDDIVAGKAGFQKADLMDYGSLYGMGSYFGQDYTAFALVRLATLTEENLAQARFGSALGNLSTEQQAAVRATMQQQLQRVDLTQREVTIPDALAGAIATLRQDLAKNLHTVDLTTGWTPAHSLSDTEALQTADFLIYSALTTVARRPDRSWSWTENWPYQPEVGNTPTTNTFMWTWISFCFTFFAFGGVLFIYQYWLSGADEGPMDPVLGTFRPLTPEPAEDRQILSRGRGGAAAADPRGHDHGACLLRSAQLLRARTAQLSAVQLPAVCAHPGSDHLDRRRVDRRRAVSRAGDRRPERGARPGSAGRSAVLGDADHRCRRADRELARHHGIYGRRVVLVRQSGLILSSSSAASGRSGFLSACWCGAP